MAAKVKTKYQKIYDTLYRQLLKGRYRPGDRFISENEICDKYDTSRMTAVRVLKMLEADRFIVRKQGKGSFVNIDPSGPAGPGDTVAMIIPTMKYLHPLVERLNILYAQSQINLKLIIQDADLEDHLDNPAYKRIIYKPTWRRESLPFDPTPYADRLVIIARKVENYAGFNIYPSEKEMGRQLVRYLYERGCTNVGYFCTFEEQLHFRLRLEGMQEAAEAMGKTVPFLFTHRDLNAVSRVKDWIEENRIDGLTVGQPQEGLLLKNTLEAIGYKVPDNIRLASFADDGTINAIGFPLPYLDRPHEALAALLHTVTTSAAEEKRTIKIETPLTLNEAYEKTPDYQPVD